MKRINLIIVFTLAAFTLSAQSGIEKVFDKYAGREGYTTVVINSFMFKFLSNIESDDPEYDNFKKATKGVESIKILVEEENTGSNLGGELLAQLPRNEYEELMVVKDAEEEVLFLIKQEEDGRISEFLLIVDSEDDDAVILIRGNIDLESISSLSSGLDLPAMESLEDFEEE